MVLSLGRGAFPVMIGECKRDIGLPPPTRAGFLYALAGVMAVTGRTDVMAVVWLSSAASVMSLLLLARIAWRFLNPLAAVFALSFYAVSSLPLMTGRRAWQDATVEMLTLCLILAGAEIVSGARHWARLLAFTIAGAACITMKEMPALIFAVLSAGVLAALWQQRSSGKTFLLFSVFWIASVGAALCWLTYLLGDARLLLKYPAMTSTFLSISPYSIAYESGTTLDLVHGMWIVSPLATICFPLGVIALRRSEFPTANANRMIAAALAGLTLLLTAAALAVPHHLNFRYLCPAFGPFYLIAGLGLNWAAAALSEQLRHSERPFFAAGIAVVLVASAVSDYETFQRRFVAPQLQDLSVKMVLGMKNN